MLLDSILKDNDALFSACRKHRYLLSRRICSVGSNLLWIMLNPSIAGATLDDLTVIKCKRFCGLWGVGRMCVVNLYSCIETDSRKLFDTSSLIDAKTDHYIDLAASWADRVVCAWGGSAEWDRIDTVITLVRQHNNDLWCLGKTANGMPKHPSRLAYATELQRF